MAWSRLAMVSIDAFSLYLTVQSYLGEERGS